MREWSGRNSNLTIDQREIHVGYRSVIASMTEANGIDLCTIYGQAINAETFVEYLERLRQKHRRVPLALFMD